MKQRAWLSRLVASTTPAIALASSPAVAQTQAQQDRLNRVAQFVVTAPFCEQLGMRIDPKIAAKAEAAMIAEASSWQLEPSVLKKLISDSSTRQLAMIETDLGASVGALKSDAQLRRFREILLGYGRTCMAAAADPIFSHLIVPPPGYDLEKSATEVSDSALEVGGIASWQTPRIQARGDLMRAAGICRSKIGAARSDALVREFGRSDDPRERGYYTKSFDEGLADPTLIETVAGCNRAIQKLSVRAR